MRLKIKNNNTYRLFNLGPYKEIVMVGQRVFEVSSLREVWITPKDFPPNTEVRYNSKMFRIKEYV